MISHKNIFKLTDNFLLVYYNIYKSQKKKYGL